MQNFGNRLVFRHEQYLARKLGQNILVVFVTFIFQQIADMQHADDVVFVLVAKRKTGVIVLFDKIHRFRKGIVLIKALHILPGNHDFMCVDFRKINCVLNNFAFGIVNNAAFFGGIDDQFDFLFRMSVIVFV